MNFKNFALKHWVEKRGEYLVLFGPDGNELYQAPLRSDVSEMQQHTDLLSYVHGQLYGLTDTQLNGARVRVEPAEWHEWWGVLFFDGEEWRIQSNRYPENCPVVHFKITGRMRRRLSQSDLYGYRAQITFPDGKAGAWIVDEAFSKR